MVRFIQTMLGVLLALNVFATDYYWKGGSGDYNDPSKWWLNSFGSGITALQAPISIDNVFFTAAAFTTPGSTVTINSNANCNNMTWDNAISVANAPTVTSSSINVNLDIYGSLALATNMQFDFQGALQFRSVDPLETIDTKGYNMRFVSLIFNGSATTEWRLLSALRSTMAHSYYNNIYVRGGHFNTQGYLIDAGSFYVQPGYGTPGLTIAGSKVRVNGDWQFTATAVSTFNALGSHIQMIQDIPWSPLTPVTFAGSNQVYDTISAVSRVTVYSGAPTARHFFAQERVALYYGTKPVFDNLYLKGGNEFYFQHYSSTPSVVNTMTLTVENVFVLGECNDYAFVYAEAYALVTIIKKTAGAALMLQKVILQNLGCDITGGRTYIANDSKNAGRNSVNWTINEATPKDLYFRDYAGDRKWHNPNNWEIWDGVSFLPNTGCIPSPNDNVFFDAASFPNAVKNVQVDSAAYCRNMTWLPGVASGATAILNKDVFVFGNFTLTNAMGTIANNTGRFLFMGCSPNTIFSDGVTVNAEMTVYSFAYYTLLDNLTARYLNGKDKSRIHGQNINLQLVHHALDSGYYNNVYATITGQGSSSGYYSFTGGGNMDYQGTTTFRFTPPNLTTPSIHFNFGVVMPNVIVDGYMQYVTYGTSATIKGDYRLNGNTNVYPAGSYFIYVTGSMALYDGNVYVTAGCTYQFATATINAAGRLFSIGDCVNNVNWTADLLNVTFSGGADIQYNFIRGWNNAPNATLTAFNSIDGSSNINVNFVSGTGVTYYWRAHSSNPTDFAGNWTDPGHWTTNPAATQGANTCLPTLADTVVFDNMSFSASSNGCTINNLASCKVLWTKAAALINGNKDLYIANSLILDPSTQYLHQAGAYITFVGSDTTGVIDTKGVVINPHTKFANAAGRWNMLSTWILRGALLLDKGRLNTNGHYLECWSYGGGSQSVFDFRNSTVYVPRSPLHYTPWSVAPGAGIYADGSFVDFNVLSSSTLTFYMGTGKQYNRVRFNSPTNVLALYNDASYRHVDFVKSTTFYGNNTFDSLTFYGGQIFYFVPGKIQTLASPHGKILVANVGGSSFVNFESTINGQIAYFHKEYGSAFCVDWLKVKDNRATKGSTPADPYWAAYHPYLQFETGVNCDNINGTATGIWAFSLPPILTVTQSHDPVFPICAGDTTVVIPIQMAGTYPYSIIYSWTDQWGNTGIDTVLVDDNDHNVFTPFTYNLTVHPYTNTNYTLDIAALRCGQRLYGAPITLAQAVLPAGQLVAQNHRGSCYLNNNSVWAHFVDEVNGRPICSVLDSTATTDHSALQGTYAWAGFDPTVQFWNGLPYLPRTWKIQPTQNGPGRVRLYFTQTELDSLEKYVFDGDIDVATELILWKFPDTIKNGAAVQVPFTVIPLSGRAADPFTSTADIYAIEFEVTSFSGFLLQPSELAVLPLELLRFEATATPERQVQLLWETGQETEGLVFEIERSVDALNFERIATMPAKGEAMNSYSLLDEHPHSGVSYYRIKLLDKDGTFSYTYLRAVELEGFEVLQVFPNPTRSGELNVLFNNPASLGQIQVEVVDVLGRRWDSGAYSLSQPNALLTLSVAHLPAGHYFLRLVDEHGIARQKAFSVQ